MASLKALRLRRTSIQSTRKITSAMKMVAASKLRRAQSAAEAARPYADAMERMLGALARSLGGQPGANRMLTGTGKSDVHLIVAISGDRGLCGGFNAQVVRATRAMVAELRAQNKQVKIVTVGRKARDQLRRDYSSLMVESYEGMMRRGVSFADADRVASKITQLFEEGDFDVCTVIYNSFKSAMTQVITRRQLVPFPVPEADTCDRSGRRGLRVRARRGRDFGAASAAQPVGPDFPCAVGKRRQFPGRADDGDGQRHAQRRRDDQSLHDSDQSHASGANHQGTHRDHLRRGSGLRIG